MSGKVRTGAGASSGEDTGEGEPVCNEWTTSVWQLTAKWAGGAVPGRSRTPTVPQASGMYAKRPMETIAIGRSAYIWTTWVSVEARG